MMEIIRHYKQTCFHYQFKSLSIYQYVYKGSKVRPSTLLAPKLDLTKKNQQSLTLKFLNLKK